MQVSVLCYVVISIKQSYCVIKKNNSGIMGANDNIVKQLNTIQSNINQVCVNKGGRSVSLSSVSEN